MPKVIHTNAKGLVQSTGVGFPAFDFLAGNQDNFAGTPVEVLEAEGAAARQAATPNAAAILAATLADDAMNTTDISGNAGQVTAIYLPAANAGAYLGLKFTDTPNGTDNLTIHASDASSPAYQSASEAARQAAGGTAAVFAKGAIIGHTNGALAAQTSDGTAEKFTITMNATHCFFDANAVLYFFCPEDGKWLVRFDGSAKGNGSAATFA